MRVNNGGCEYLLWPKTCDKSCSITYRQASSKLFKLPKLTHNNTGQGWVTGGNPDKNARDTQRPSYYNNSRWEAYVLFFRVQDWDCGRRILGTAAIDLKNFENKKNPVIIILLSFLFVVWLMRIMMVTKITTKIMINDNEIYLAQRIFLSFIQLLIISFPIFRLPTIMYSTSLVNPSKCKCFTLLSDDGRCLP